jgi:hypothetical protein
MHVPSRHVYEVADAVIEAIFFLNKEKVCEWCVDNAGMLCHVCYLHTRKPEYDTCYGCKDSLP